MHAKRITPQLGALALKSGLLGFALLAFGCASTSQLSISPSSKDGSAVHSNSLSVERTHLVSIGLLRRTFSRELDELPAFLLTVENRGDEALMFLPVNVVAFSGDEAARIYEPAELAERIQNAAQRDADEYSGRQAEVFLQSDATRQDPSSAMATITAAKRTNNAAAKRESWDKLLAEVATLIAPASVEPGRSYSGNVKLHAEDIEADEPLRIVVTFDGEAYEFVFDVARE